MLDFWRETFLNLSFEPKKIKIKIKLKVLKNIKETYTKNIFKNKKNKITILN